MFVIYNMKPWRFLVFLGFSMKYFGETILKTSRLMRSDKSLYINRSKSLKWNLLCGLSDEFSFDRFYPASARNMGHFSVDSSRGMTSRD